MSNLATVIAEMESKAVEAREQGTALISSYLIERWIALLKEDSANG